MTVLVILSLAALAFILLLVDRPGLAGVIPLLLGLVLWQIFGSPGLIPWILSGMAIAIFAVPELRRMVVSGPVLSALGPHLPRMSETEKVALDAGTVWWDGDLFSGNPDWDKLLAFRGPGLSPKEQSFLDNEVEQICALVKSEEVDATGDLSPAAWSMLKNSGFMALIIPEQYGGLGFSAEAVSAIVTKVSSHNVTLAVTIMLPSSLGPAELLMHYGTQAQRKHWLPRLANGSEIPAFALTEPFAGSDAGAMRSKGVVCKGDWNGEQVLGLRLNWDKRYITLAPNCTLLGLAFKAEDPDGLLGSQKDFGITCALVPANMPGVQTGLRHDPLGVKFINGPTTGKDVFLPLDNVIGGRAGLGQGWRMLMDCLSAGRAISLPGLAAGALETATLATSAYGAMREQFGLPIGKMEGVAAPIGRIAGTSWMVGAARELTAAAVAQGEKPSVISAIMKAWCTEAMRTGTNDAMDVMAGAAICRGPRNVLARFYQALPIGITVEGANILTRTLIIFGQGALRCHPQAQEEVRAAMAGDVEAFDKAFSKHLGGVASTTARALWFGLTGGGLTTATGSAEAARLVNGMTRFSAAFALCTEVAMGTLGGELKRREELSGRLADALAWLYFGSAALHRYESRGCPKEEEPFMRWAGETCLVRCQDALDGLLRNLPMGFLGACLRRALFPFGRPYGGPSDELTADLARRAMEHEPTRAMLSACAYIPSADEPGLGRLDASYQRLRKMAPLRKKLRDAIRKGTLPRGSEIDLLDQAEEAGVLSGPEVGALSETLRMRDEQMLVDAFDAEQYLSRCGS